MYKTQTMRHKCNRALRGINSAYHTEIPLSEIFAIVRYHIGQVVQEDGTPWSGFLLGDNGNTDLEIAGFRFGKLHLSWYKMQSTGRYEVVVYVT